MSVPPVAQPGVDRLAVAAALVTVVLWASAFVGIRAVTEDLSAGALAFGRLAIGGVGLGVLVAYRGWRRPSRRSLGLIVASGVSWFAVYNLALNEAERIVDAGTAAMLVNTGPIFIAILAGVFLGEGLPGRLLAGIAIAFVGAITIGIATAEQAAIGADAGLGIALCLVAALAYAIGVVVQKPALRDTSALQLTWLACVAGAVVCLPFAPSLVAELGTASGASIAWLVYLGIFPTSVAFTTWAFALSRTTAGRLGVMTYLIPPVAIALAWLMLTEVPPPLAIAGGALCIAGVIVARSRRLPAWRRWRRAPGEVPS